MFVVNYPPPFTLQLIKHEVITMYIVQLLVFNGFLCLYTFLMSIKYVGATKP